MLKLCVYVKVTNIQNKAADAEGMGKPPRHACADCSAMDVQGVFICAF
jgi:hypothetical protein